MFSHERLQLKFSAQSMAVLQLFVAISDDYMLLIFLLVHTVTKESGGHGVTSLLQVCCHPILFLYFSRVIPKLKVADALVNIHKHCGIITTL